MFIILVSPTSLFAATPVLNSVDGEMIGLTGGNVVVINGSNFGNKTSSRPWIWADFEGCTTNPSAYGYKENWSVTQFIESTSLESFSGNCSITSSDGWQNQIFRVRVTTNTTTFTPGSWWFVSLKRRVTYGYFDLNIKWVRWWNTVDSNYPNMYWSTQGDQRTARIISIERVPDSSKTVQIASDYPHPGQTPGQEWRTEQYLIKRNLSTAAHDGAAYSYVFLPSSGSFFASSTTWATDSTNAPGSFDEVSIQDDPSNGTAQPATGFAEANVWYDDIYVDLSAARVFLSDSATFVADNVSNENVNMLVPFEWSDTQVSVYANDAGFLPGSLAYIYVCNPDNECNANGYEVVTGVPSIEFRGVTLTGVGVR